MKRIDYGKLLPGMIVGTTCGYNPLSWIIRGTEAGACNIFNPNVASHVLAIVREHDLLYGMEMTYPQIRQVDLNEYEHTAFGEHIVFCAAPFNNYEMLYEKQDAANKFLLHSHTLSIKYDIVQLLKWWNWPVNDDPKKLVCGDLTYAMMKVLQARYPVAWDQDMRRHDPWDQQRYFTDKVQLVKWWK